jgi:cytidylate kinase
LIFDWAPVENGGFVVKERRPEQARIRDTDESPRHGNQGDRAPAPKAPSIPVSLTIAVSRETGSHGGTIAHRAARKLGWTVYNQELLEYVAQEGAFRQGVAENQTPAAAAWAERHLDALVGEQKLSPHPSIRDLARVVLALGAQGECVLIGRGAGRILPAESTLDVRIIAPLEDRIAYMSQRLRLSLEAAAEEVKLRDRQRGEFIVTHFHRQPTDMYQYDLILNSSHLGEEVCAELIAQAARAKLAIRERNDGQWVSQGGA